MIEVTRKLAQFAVDSKVGGLPPGVVAEGVRAFVNWFGCALGGCREAAVDIAAAVQSELGGRAEALLIGRPEKLNVVGAAEINCLSSSVHAFDDTHLATVTHPTGPVAAAILALAAAKPCRGAEFIHALVLGMEIELRLARMLAVGPAQCNLGFYMTGLAGSVGAAAAAGRLLGLDVDRMIFAIGIGAIQSSGFRETHATMCSGLVPALAARNGTYSALLASKGFTSSSKSIESAKGFAGVFGSPSHPVAAIERLGEHFEMLATTYKAYPCGIVIHPAIDACLDLVAANKIGAGDIASVEVSVNDLAIDLTGKPSPRSGLEAQVSVYHWAAAALVKGRATLAEATDGCVNDPAVLAMRARISVNRDANCARDEAKATVTTHDGQRISHHVVHCKGSADRPLSDAELDAKFLDQGAGILSKGPASSALDLCRNVLALPDVDQAIRRQLAS